MGIVSPTSQELLYNSIGFGVPAFLFFFLRISNRVFVMRSIKGEDVCMILAMCFYTSLLFFINYSSTYATNLYPPEQSDAIFANPQDVSDRIFGSKLVIPLEQSMLASTWLVKLCIWSFVLRIAEKTNYERHMFFLLSYIIIGYVTIQICYFAILCRPFKQYWAMPVTNSQCTTYQHYSIIQMVFNVTSDLALFYVPLAIVKNTQLKPNRKVLIIIPFSMGLATVMCAVLNKYYNFASPMTTTYQLWYIRESSISIWVGNIICTWQLLQKLFHLHTFDNKHAHIQPETSSSERLSEHRDLGWKQKFLGMQIAAGNFIGITKRDTTVGGADTELGTRGSASAVSEADTVEREKERHREKRGQFGSDMNRSFLMTLRRDGDDASPSVDYRKKFDIA